MRWEFPVKSPAGFHIKLPAFALIPDAYGVAGALRCPRELFKVGRQVMRMLLSAFLKLAAIASLGYWWLWLFLGTAYHYLIQHDSLWSSMQSGAGMTLVIFVVGMMSVQLSEVLAPIEEYTD